MAHCPPERLDDLAAELREIATWEGIREQGRGIYYLKPAVGAVVPFLHFHVKGEERWADVREGRSWGARLPIADGASAVVRARFLREVRRRHGRTR